MLFFFFEYRECFEVFYVVICVLMKKFVGVCLKLVCSLERMRKILDCDKFVCVEWVSVYFVGYEIGCWWVLSGVFEVVNFSILLLLVSFLFLRRWCRVCRCIGMKFLWLGFCRGKCLEGEMRLLGFLFCGDFWSLGD